LQHKGRVAFVTRFDSAEIDLRLLLCQGKVCSGSEKGFTALPLGSGDGPEPRINWAGNRIGGEALADSRSGEKPLI